MIGNDDHPVAVPNFRELPKFALEDPDSPRAANIMGHQDIGPHPNVFACLCARLAGGPGEDLLGQSHGRVSLSVSGWHCNSRNQPWGCPAAIRSTWDS